MTLWVMTERIPSPQGLTLAHMGRPHPQTPQARTKLKVAGYCLMVPTPNPAFFAATPPPIPAQEAPFGWQLPTIDRTHTPATHPASPHSPETARLEFLSTVQIDQDFCVVALADVAVECTANQVDLLQALVGLPACQALALGGIGLRGRTLALADHVPVSGRGDFHIEEDQAIAEAGDPATFTSQVHALRSNRSSCFAHAPAEFARFLGEAELEGAGVVDFDAVHRRTGIERVDRGSIFARLGAGDGGHAVGDLEVDAKLEGGTFGVPTRGQVDGVGGHDAAGFRVQGDLDVVVLQRVLGKAKGGEQEQAGEAE